MDEIQIERLRKAAGMSQKGLGAAADVSRQYIAMVESEKRPISPKVAGKVAGILGVGEDELFVTHNMRVIRNGVEAGTIPPDKALKSIGHVVKFMDAAPGFDRKVADAALKEGERLAHQLIAKKDTQALVGRDGVGRATKSAVGGVRSSYANDFPAASPTGYFGGGRPSTEGIAHPSVRALADGVLGLEQDIDDGTISGHQILGAVGTVVNSFVDEAVQADSKASAEWLKRLQKLANEATQDIGSSSATKSSEAGRGREAGNHRGAGGVARTKRYGA